VDTREEIVAGDRRLAEDARLPQLQLPNRWKTFRVIVFGRRLSANPRPTRVRHPTLET
jgi:hypothetical protein